MLVHYQYTSGIVRIEVQTLPSTCVYCRFTAKRQAHTGPITSLVTQDVAFNAVQYVGGWCQAG